MSTTINGSKHTYTADSFGNYSISSLSQVIYSLKFSAKGYSDKTVAATVVSNTTITVNATLTKSGKK